MTHAHTPPALKALTLVALAATLAGCALQRPPTQVAAPLPTAWQAPQPAAAAEGPPLPHQGRRADLAAWWSRLDDPLLTQLITAAQEASPDLAQAQSRLAEARANRVVAGAALLPTVDASATAQRGFSQFVGGVATTGQAQLQTSWELDLFGANRAARDAAQARWRGAEAQWHGARVTVAADTANQYYAVRSCTQLLAVAESDGASRAETARLSRLSKEAGFTAPASLALADASAAEAAGRVAQQRQQCDVDTKALVALTGLPEPELRSRLAAAGRGPLVRAPESLLAIDSLPAVVLAQRPDLFAAELDVAAASADVGQAEAQRYPSLRVGGSVGRLHFAGRGNSVSTNVWTVGPITLSAPLFDGGKSRANVEANRAAYEAAAAVYRGKVRQAVREVEEALVNLDATALRAQQAQAASQGYRASFTATEARYRGGLASLVELEDARRTALAADNTVVGLQRERMAAWVALYRAVGGGWERPVDAATAQATTPVAAAATTTR